MKTATWTLRISGLATWRVTRSLNQPDLADWEANYSTSVSQVTSASTAVPEPSTWLMLMIGMAVLLAYRRAAVSRLNWP